MSSPHPRIAPERRVPSRRRIPFPFASMYHGMPAARKSVFRARVLVAFLCLAAVPVLRLALPGAARASDTSTLALSAPTYLLATSSSSSTSITLSWNPSTGATSYRVYRATTSGGPYTLATTVTTTSATVAFTSQNSGTRYYFVVRAVQSSTESANSNEASAVVGAAMLTPQNNTVLRGGFEAPTLSEGTFAYGPNVPAGSPWTFSSGTGVNAGMAYNNSAFNNGTTPDGLQIGFMQKAGSFSQVIPFTAGTYKLSFYATARLTTSTPVDFHVLVDGEEVGYFNISNGPSAWATLTTDAFTVTAANHQITFEGVNTLGGDRTVFVDYIRLITSTGTNPTPTPTATPTPSTGIVALANAYIATLSTTQKSVTVLTSSATNAAKWSNLPATPGSDGTNDLRNGVSYSTLTDTQKTAWVNLVKAALGTTAYNQFTQIRYSDYYLGSLRSGYSGDYEYVAFVGTPSTSGSWLLQVGGHHNAHNYYYTGNNPQTTTPYFLGVEPTTFTYNGTSYTPLSAQSNGMYNLINSLTSTQLASAKLSSNFSDVYLGPGQDARSNFPTGTTGRGLLASNLTTAQQSLMKTAIAAWTQNSPLASTYQALYASELSQTYVAYSGTTALNTQGDYVRIDGPHVWIEFVCQNGVVVSGKIHYHTIWRDRVTDYNAAYGF